MKKSDKPDGNLKMGVRGPLWAKIVLVLISLTHTLVCSFWHAVNTEDYPVDRLFHISPPSVQFFDMRKVLLREFSAEKSRFQQWVNLKKISPDLINATIAAEDMSFYKHEGVDFSALFRAFKDNLFSRRIVSGASTITMQLVRLLNKRERSYVSKVIEIIEAYRLERILSKDQILEQYFNRLFYGNGAVGVEAGAWSYFRKPSSHLSLAESAFLAVIPRSPGLYNPYKNFNRVKKMQERVLGRMKSMGYSSEEIRAAFQEKIQIKKPSYPFMAPHFTRFLKKQLAHDYPGVKFQKVHTTLDFDLQRKIEGIVRREIAQLKEKSVTNASVLVMENETGKILAWVGSENFANEKNSGQVDGVISLRQPGSTLKPFTYALALMKGYTAATVMEDIETHFTIAKGHSFVPKNYSNHYYGPVRIRSALASSLNVSAFAAAKFAGQKNLLETLQNLGFSSLTKKTDYYGLGLTMGNGEVTLLELVSAYAALARGGVYKKPQFYTLLDETGGKFTKYVETPSRRVLPEDISYIITHILADPNARIQGFGLLTPFNFPFHVAVKTGTSSNWRDNFTLGFTKTHTIGVWVGNFDGHPMRHVSGATGAGPIFRYIIMALTEGKRPDPFTPPTPFVTRTICPLSGKLPGSQCPHTIQEIFIPGTEPSESCNFHQSVSIDRRNGLLAGPRCSHSILKPFAVYPPQYAAWVKTEKIPTAPMKYSPFCPGETREMKAPIIKYPKDGAHFLVDPSRSMEFQQLPLKALVFQENPRCTWIINNKPFATVSSPCTVYWPLSKGKYQISLSVKGISSKPVKITVR